MVNFNYLSSGNEERIYEYLNSLSNCQGCFCNKSYIRFFHTVTAAPAVDIYIDDSLVAENLKFGEMTDYVLCYPANYNISVYAARDNTNPLFSETIALSRNIAYTGVLNKSPAGFGLLLIKETKNDIPPIRESAVSFSNFVFSDNYLDLLLSDGTTIFRDVSYNRTTPNVLVFPISEIFSVKFANESYIAASTPETELQRNTYYMLFSLIDEDGMVRLIITESGLNYLDIC